MGFAIHPQQVQMLGSNLERVGLEAAGEFSGPHATVTSISPWGSDEGGAELSRAHTELASIAGEVLSLFAETLETLGHNVRAMGESVAETDDAERANFNTIAGEVGGLA